MVTSIHVPAQKRADLYSDAGTFDPERFVGDRPDTRDWIPFGGGAHHCLGAQFALIESRVLLKTILRQRAFAPDSSPDERQVQHRSVMTLPGRGAMVTLLDRQGVPGNDKASRDHAHDIAAGLGGVDI